MSLNNIFPIVGAIILALYQSRRTNIIRYSDSWIQFTDMLNCSLFVVLSSCLTIHVDLLAKDLLVFHIIHMTTVHYILVFGFGLVWFSHYVVLLLSEHRTPGSKFTWIPFLFINVFNIICTSHILFLKDISTIL